MRARFRRGAAMPFVLFGMAMAMGIITLVWTRSMNNASRSQFQIRNWQAQLLAESGLACALDANSPGNSSALAEITKLVEIVSGQTASDAPQTCRLHDPEFGQIVSSPPVGKLFLTVHATGTVGKVSPITKEFRATLGGIPDPELFRPAVSLWSMNAPIPELGARCQGLVRVNTDQAMPIGMQAQIGSFSDFIPASAISMASQYAQESSIKFRSDKAHLGGAAYTPGHPPENASQDLIHTLGDVTFQGPASGEPWKPEPARTLWVEGKILVRGSVDLSDWNLISSQSIKLEGVSVVRNGVLVARQAVVLRDKARVQGQVWAAGALEIRDRAVLLPPSIGLVQNSTGSDSAARITITSQSKSEAYLMALGMQSQIWIGAQTVHAGVLVSQGRVRIDGTLEGMAVADRLDCGQSDRNCLGSGSVLRNRLPRSFAFPVGLPQQRGLRLLAWSSP